MDWIASLFGGYSTCWAGALLASHNKTLFGIISNVGSEDRVNVPYKSISTVHINAVLPSIDEGCKNRANAFVEQLMPLGGPVLLCKAFEL